MLRTDDFVKGQLVLAAWRHTREYGGNHIPAVMVMGCLMNRVRLGWGSHLEIIERIPKFSATVVQPCNSIFPSIWEPSFTRLLHEVEAVYDNSGIDLSKGALYWCDLRYIDNQWFKDNILGDQEHHPRVANFNSLTFFR